MFTLLYLLSGFESHVTRILSKDLPWRKERDSVCVWEMEGFGMGLGLSIQAERQRMRRYLT